MRVNDLIKDRRADILRLASQYGARNVRVFGSVARGDADELSDIDFLVDLDEDRNLLDLGGLLMDLRALLNRDVDVVTADGLRARIKERVLREAVPV